MLRPPPRSPLFPSPPLFRSAPRRPVAGSGRRLASRSRQTLVAIRYSQARNVDRPSKVSRLRQARRNVSCTLRSEEHTSELQSLRHLVCRLLLEKKKKQQQKHGKLTLFMRQICSTNRNVTQT